MKIKLLVVLLLVTSVTFAQGVVHSITFKDAKFVTFVGQREFNIYPLSERAMPAIQSSVGREVIAVDYLTSIKIKTEDPTNAAQAIMGQISDGIGEKLSPFWNSKLQSTKPSAILTGVGKSSTWSIFITPTEGGEYLVTISYVIEKPKE